MDIKILNESEIVVYSKPDVPTKQRVITYQVDGMAPHTIWLDAVKIPDAAYQIKNPGKTAPADVQTLGDKYRRAAIEADVAKIKAAPTTRTI